MTEAGDEGTEANRRCRHPAAKRHRSNRTKGEDMAADAPNAGFVPGLELAEARLERSVARQCRGGVEVERGRARKRFCERAGEARGARVADRAAVGREFTADE